MCFHVIHQDIATNSINKIRLPWFRVHIVILNDPGRLISVHIMHTALAAGWSAVIVLYELITFDPTDPVYNPSFRQGCYLIPFISRIGCISSQYSWSLGIKLSINHFWTYETINSTHISLSGLFILAAFWHWAYSRSMAVEYQASWAPTPGCPAYIPSSFQV